MIDIQGGTNSAAAAITLQGRIPASPAAVGASMDTKNQIQDANEAY